MAANPRFAFRALSLAILVTLVGCGSAGSALDDLARLAGRSASSTRTLIQTTTSAADETRVIQFADESLLIVRSADDAARAASTADEDVAQLRELATELACDLYDAGMTAYTLPQVQQIVQDNGWLATVPSADANEFAAGALATAQEMEGEDFDVVEIACALFP